MLGRYKHILTLLFYKVQELQSSPLGKRLIGLEIQEELLNRLSSAERIIRKARVEIKAIKLQMSNTRNARRASLNLKKTIEKKKEIIRRQRLLLWILRSIGDAIAFIYGDRWDLKQLYLKESAGFITGKKGTKLERGLLRCAYAVGATVVMNDLTNTLRYGDITLFRPDLWPNGGSPFLLFEAKSGKGGNKSRAERQRNAIKEISDYIYSNKREVENGQWLRVSTKTFPRHHFVEVENMGDLLHSSGWVLREVEPGLYYLMLDCTINYSLNEVFSSLLEQNIRPYVINVNSLKEETLGYYPFPLCFLSPEMLFHFYNGKFVMYVIVDLNTVNTLLSQYDLSIEIEKDANSFWKIIPKVFTGSGFNQSEHYYIGHHIIGRLGGEFLRLDWLIENVIVSHIDGKLSGLISEAN